MPGGRLPRRSDQVRHRDKGNGPALTKGASRGAEWMEPDPEWHPIAEEWYRSLAESGQEDFYEQSDVATAYYVAEAMSRSLAGVRMSGQMFAAVMASMTDLLTTEGARRRARVELDRTSAPVGDDPKVTAMDRYRKAAGGGA